MIVNRFNFRAFDVLLLLSVCLVLYFFDLGRAPFFDKQEPREALVVWEINHSGSWILPLRNGNEIPSKPPLYHWLAALVSQALNQMNEFTVRFPSALLATIGVLLVYLAGAGRWSRAAGLISAMVLATSYEWRQAAKAARVDMTLTFALLCAFLYFLHLYRHRGGRMKWMILGIFLGLATVAKGPLGIVVPCFAFSIFLCLQRDTAFVKKINFLVLICTWAVLAGSWYALALWQGGGEFLDVVIKENFSMVIGQDAGHPHGFFWYVPAFFQNAAPWSLFIFPIAIWLYKSRRQLAQDDTLYFVVWFLAVFVFFSAFTQKRSVYILGSYPAFALLFGGWFQKLNTAESASGRFLAKAAGYLSGAAFLLLSAVLLVQVAQPGLATLIGSGLRPKDQAQMLILGKLLSEHRSIVYLWAVFCGLGGIFLIVVLTKTAWRPYFACMIGLMVVSMVFEQRFDNYLAEQYSYKAFMQRVLAIVKDDPLYFYREGDFGATFYANKRITTLDKPVPKELSRFYLLCWESDWRELSDQNGLSLEYASDSTDRQNPARGHLYLIKGH